jgi:hypothetical protein
MRATRPASQILLGLIILIISDEEFKIIGTVKFNGEFQFSVNTIPGKGPSVDSGQEVEQASFYYYT